MNQQSGALGSKGDSVLPELGKVRPRPSGVQNLVVHAVGFLKS